MECLVVGCVISPMLTSGYMPGRCTHPSTATVWEIGSNACQMVQDYDVLSGLPAAGLTSVIISCSETSVLFISTVSHVGLSLHESLHLTIDKHTEHSGRAAPHSRWMPGQSYGEKYIQYKKKRSNVRYDESKIRKFIWPFKSSTQLLYLLQHCTVASHIGLLSVWNLVLSTEQVVYQYIASMQ